MPGRAVHRGGEGFTLVELIVVIAVVLLLLSILMPVLGEARDVAKTTICASNLRQIGVMAHVYLSDSGGYMLPSDADEADDDFVGWQTFLHLRYAWGRDEMFQCPTIAPGGHFRPADPHGMSTELSQVSYVMNVIRPDNWTSQVLSASYMQIARRATAKGWTGVTANTTFSSDDPLHISRLTRSPGDAIYIVDHRPGYATDMQHGSVTRAMCEGIWRFGETDHSIKQIETIGTPRMKVGADVHGNPRFNVLYGDAHVKAVTRTRPEQWAVGGQ